MPMMTAPQASTAEFEEIGAVSKAMRRDFTKDTPFFVLHGHTSLRGYSAPTNTRRLLLAPCLLGVRTVDPGRDFGPSIFSCDDMMLFMNEAGFPDCLVSTRV
jgi:hypothetical protein